MKSTTQAGAADESTISKAEQEAAEAEQLIDTLEEKVRDGDDTVTPEQIANARELGRFAKLRAEATRRKVARAKAAARLAACEDLRTEIEQHATGAGAHFAELLKAAEDAVSAFVAAVDERNSQIRTWGKRVRWDLGVPEHIAPVSPPAEHGRLGYHGQKVIAGRRILDTVDVNHWLSAMLRRVTRPSTGERVQITAHDYETDVYGRLAEIDATRPEPSPDLVFFRGPNGGVQSYDPGHVPSAEDIKRLRLTRISRKEAWGA